MLVVNNQDIETEKTEVQEVEQILMVLILVVVVLLDKVMMEVMPQDLLM